jgi:hypothetical protein
MDRQLGSCIYNVVPDSSGRGTYRCATQPPLDIAKVAVPLPTVIRRCRYVALVFGSQDSIVHE